MTVTTKPKAKSETEKLFADLDKPSLHALSYALRHPDTWPDGFVWDYKECDQCAMGLAHCLWRSSIPEADTWNGASIMAKKFAMPYGEAENIFFNHKAVTPEMVADQIDKYLERAE